MLRSLFSAISGLQANQTFMDVTGNNIANVNTVGYKASRATFEDMLSQTVRGGTAPTAQTGGINPAQVGLGVQVASIGIVNAQGNLQATQSPTDLAIQGDGFFILNNGAGGQLYTRDGGFSLGRNGILTNEQGLQVMGWTPNAATGVIDQSQPLQAVTIPTGDQMIGQPSTQVNFKGNLDERLDATAAPPANQVTSTVNLYDSLGRDHQVTVTFTKTSNPNNTWSWAASTAEAGVTVSGSGNLTFDPASGAFKPAGPPPDGTIGLTLTNGAASPQSVKVAFESLTQVAATSSIDGPADGLAPGSLSSFTIGADGTVTGVYSNGLQKLLGQVATASFTNPQGLMRQGGNAFSSSPNSGAPVVGAPNSGGRGALSSGFLEMS
ncbi:MAG: flagellar hook protein FlgE, partial [Candidatus Dormibacteraceae bacterium]